MYPVPPHFQPRTEADLIDLVENAPLAWLVAPDLSAMLLPMRLVVEGGRLTALRGHMPRRIAERFRVQPEALVLVAGPNAYISPSWFSNRVQAPTWASASASFRCSVRLIEDQQELRDGLADLVEAMEKGRADPWRLEELGDRYEPLASRIVAFRAEVEAARPAFRLGQDEDVQTFSEILTGLRADGNDDVAALMERFRP